MKKLTKWKIGLLWISFEWKPLIRKSRSYFSVRWLIVEIYIYRYPKDRYKRFNIF